MNCRTLRSRTVPLLFVAAVVSLAVPASVMAQGPPPPAGPPPTPEQIAPLNLTGYWVSVVTEDWRYRMITPAKGDFESVPLNPEGRRVANTWDPAKDTASGNQCKAYGAGGIMRVPERLHITWENPTTLKVETDAGMQTRLLHFDGKPPAGEAPGWQGYSVASWEGLRPGGRILAAAPQGGVNAPPLGTPGAAPARTAEGYLKVMTTNVRPGYLRKNGVPYSANAVVEEYFDSFTEPNNDTWLVVTTIVTDPLYLQRPFIVSSHFKKLADASGWNPTPCAAK
jgi:hypothetical protein